LVQLALSFENDHGIIAMDIMPMKTISAGEFKTNCLAIMDEVKLKRETVVITKRGEPVAKLVPIHEEVDGLFGFFSGRGKVIGDVVAPAFSPEEWGELQ
jgi:prevent-host-death family protein